MPPKRRPAGWHKAGEIDTDTLLGWPWVRVKGRFWDEDVELIGKTLEVKRRDSGRELAMKVSGTPSESAVEGAPMWGFFAKL